ncbi:MAG: hypothetical protein RJA19_1044 [Bacteroidota bacterium]|jgi:uncharacterized protein (TIGR02421 family)
MSGVLSLSSAQIIDRIRSGRDFEAVATDTGMHIRISAYVPHVATAIHAGSAMRHELQLKCALDAFSRWQEEDPDTDAFIAGLPITVVGTDSRYAYDLNRGPETAVYEEAWGKRVWSRALTAGEKARSLGRHRRFHEVMQVLTEELLRRHGACVVYDIHSYNGKRWNRPVPTWNLGTDRLDPSWAPEVAHFAELLSAQPLPAGIDPACAVNDVFQGHGYNLAHLSRPGCLVLATEVCKVYCDEETGERFPATVEAVGTALRAAITTHAHAFAQRHTHAPGQAVPWVQRHPIDAVVRKVDKELYTCVRDLEVLHRVNPTNVAREKRAFFASRAALNPQFTYRPLALDPLHLKRQLLRIPVERIEDASLRLLYESTVSAYLDKVDMLATIGTPAFRYNSLRYYGAPSPTDLKNAAYLLHLPDLATPRPEKRLGAEHAVRAFAEGMAEYGLAGKIEISDQIVASAMVLNAQRKVLIRKGATFTPVELRYLVHHEIGVHMVTTMNALEQPLKLLRIGTRVSTRTQEGLAVLAEYLSGNMTLERLRELAYRVLAVDRMVHGADFVETYRFLTREWNMEAHAAWALTTRVQRGGGFTKDYLYLQGLREVFGMWRGGEDLRPLLIGKCSIEVYDSLRELLDRGVLQAPKHLPLPLLTPTPEHNDPIFDYIMRGLR